MRRDRRPQRYHSGHPAVSAATLGGNDHSTGIAAVTLAGPARDDAAAVAGPTADSAEIARAEASIRRHGLMGIDTEFITERSFRPLLALVQVATPDGIWLIDPLAGGAPDQPIWNCMADPAITTVVHAHEQETRFCIARTARPPASLFDVQLAAGFAGHRFPISYNALIGAALGRRAADSQSRSEWTRRPLSAAQVRYAADDVRWLLPLQRRLAGRLGETGRRAWLEEETALRLDAVSAQERGGRDGRAPRWRRLSGAGKLRPRSLEALRRLHGWREQAARLADSPVKRIAADPLLVAVAAALPRSINDLLRIRGASDLPRRHRRPVLDVVAAALDAEDDALPCQNPDRPAARSEKALRRFLEAVMEAACTGGGIDSHLVGSSADLADLIRWQLARTGSEDPPKMLRGWRGELCGEEMQRAIDGRVALRIADPAADQPLATAPVPAP